jgi:salicylate hydroxylase
MGVADALCLCTLIDRVNATTAQDKTSKRRALEIAFEGFNHIRRARSQWLVKSSLRGCDLYHQEEWADPKRRTKAEINFG